MNDAAGTDVGAIRAVILDMDGVVTDTAEAHFKAWKEVFDDLLDRRDASPFTRGDYLEHVDGVPRHDGIRRFLTSRGIDLPEGDPDDTDLTSVRGIGNAKNQRFHDWLRDNAVPVFEDARAFIEGLRKDGLKLGVFSASRNARRVLESAKIATLFDSIVDGAEAEHCGCAPKPAPDQLLVAARRLGAEAEETLVIEDAVAGVKAGAAGRFALVLGIDRQQATQSQRHALRVNGADLVTRDLARLLLPGGAGLRTLSRLPSFAGHAEEVGNHISGRRLSVFLDFDGTLSPIVDDYREATMPEATRHAVERLAKMVPVAIISGRDLDDLRGRVRIDSVIHAGSHGFDIAGPDMSKHPQEAHGFDDALDAAETALRDALSGIPGARIERKSFAIAVHFREANPGDAERIENTVTRIAADQEALRTSRGKKVVEVQPSADWDKGRAVAWLLSETQMGDGNPLPVYVGDDLTDEDAFGALSDEGLLIAVRDGGRATLADYAINGPGEACRFIDWLAERARETS